MSRQYPTPTDEAMIRLSGVLAALREAEALIERDTVVSPEMLASITGALALLGQQVRDFTDQVGRKVRAVPPGAYESTANLVSTSEVINMAHREVEYARRSFQGAHEHFVKASNDLGYLKRVDLDAR